MEKIKKFLLKLSKIEREKIESAVVKIAADDISNLDVKKLKGYEDIFRIHVGKNRIIFKRNEHQNRILEISRRSDIAYKYF